MLKCNDLNRVVLGTLGVAALVVTVALDVSTVLAQCTMPTPEFVCANPGADGYCWDGGGSGNNWTTAANWAGDDEPPNDGTAKIYHLGGGTINMNAGTDAVPFIVASMIVRGDNDGKLVIESGHGLQVQSAFINCDTDPENEYVLEVDDEALLKVQDADDEEEEYDLVRVRADMIGDDQDDGDGGTVFVTGQIVTDTNWLIETDSSLDTHSISLGGNSWQVETGASVKSDGFGIELGQGAGAFDECAAFWDINNGHVEVNFAENPICWTLSGDPNETGGSQELYSINKIAALRIVMDNEAELEIGDNTVPDWGLLLAQFGEAVIDDSTMTLPDIKARQGSTITLRNGGTLTTEEMGEDEGNGDRAGIGSLFYGDGSNVFISEAATTLFQHDGTEVSDAIIALDHDSPSNANLAMTIGGNFVVTSRTDLTFSYTVNVEQQDETTINATWDTRGVDLHVADDTSLANIEVVNVDFDGVWFCDNNRMKAWDSFEVGDDATAKLTNGISNQFHGSGTPPFEHEAMFVDGDVTVGDGATLDLNGIELYLTGSVIEGSDADVDGTPNDGITKTCYGDFDNDGDIDDADRCTFCAAYTGSGTPTSNVLVDFDLDGDVDPVDRTAFVANYNGEGYFPRCPCHPSGPAPLYESAPDPLCTPACP